MLESGGDRGPKKETGFLVNKYRETPTNRACKTFIFPTPFLISSQMVGVVERKESRRRADEIAVAEAPSLGIYSRRRVQLVI